MICISINQESRRMALVDMLNAAKQCDLLELRLDRFDKAPDFGELMAVKPKPVIMSCRRLLDGGYWQGSEEERLALLRQCIISKADYVEIELDVADQIRRFPPSQRVISYTNLQETPADILDIYEEAQSKNPDVIKLTTLARTPEEAWPLVQILAKPRIPTVVVGLGKPGIMLSILGKKIGAPWTYAALERGMEAYPGQATVHDLNHIYHYPSINRSTRLIGVTGFGEREYLTVAILNKVMAQLDLPARCLPLGVGSVRLFRKVMDAVKLAAVVIDAENQGNVLEIANQAHPTAQQAEAADVLVSRDDGWHAIFTGAKAMVHALGETIKAKTGSANPLKDRIVLIVGLTVQAQVLAREFVQRGNNVILASHQRKACQQLAQIIGCRSVQFEALYSTMHDVLVVADEEKEESHGRTEGIRAGYLKPSITVLDLTSPWRPSPLLREAANHGCPTVDPRRLFFDQLELQARLIIGKQVPREMLEKAVPEGMED